MITADDQQLARLGRDGGERGRETGRDTLGRAEAHTASADRGAVSTQQQGIDRTQQKGISPIPHTRVQAALYNALKPDKSAAFPSDNSTEEPLGSRRVN